MRTPRIGNHTFIYSHTYLVPNVSVPTHRPRYCFGEIHTINSFSRNRLKSRLTNGSNDCSCFGGSRDHGTFKCNPKVI